jgi:hypothetical protein
MAKHLKASAKAGPSEKRATKRLSLYPLDLETALGAALRIKPPSKDIPKKPSAKK